MIVPVAFLVIVVIVTLGLALLALAVGDHAKRRALVHRMEAGFRFLDERWRVYQHLIKSAAKPFVAPPCVEPIAHEALARRAA